ncbi:tail protein X [Vibrio phage 1.111.B._10N.286.45.E6]|nr:tail protein X [Vibrio phage 1.111.A._10N.286.45.E6]AUR88287.1 tail protein X [Vibrio phage 1.111.B._10N.286.45.E6]
MIYKTKGGEMLDEICFAHYGTDKNFSIVLANNIGLEFQPFILPAGIEIKLPEIVEKETKGVTLW